MTSLSTYNSEWSINQLYNGHEGIVKLLLATGKVDVEVNDDCSVSGGSYSGGSWGGGGGGGRDWDWD